MAEYKNLLQTYTKFTDINEERKRLGINDYSIINALLKKDREVELHSNFIYSMINFKGGAYRSGDHCCGDNFLRLFLECIGHKETINLNNASVYREKDKIDLLIEDGENYIIIENKLKAGDQKHQISRYIQVVIDKYLSGDSGSFKGNIFVVYMSEYKVISDRSTCGFKPLEHNHNKLVWEGEKVILSNGKELNLDKGHTISFKRVKHTVELQEWVERSIGWLSMNRPSSQNLTYAFKEYGLILKRIKSRSWRNIMSLSDYVAALEDEKEKREMYEFMVDANNSLCDYVVDAINKTIEEIKPKSEINGLLKYSISECKKWVEGSRKDWKNIGFKFTSGSQDYVFCMGKAFIYIFEEDVFTKAIASDSESIFISKYRIGGDKNYHRKDLLKKTILLKLISGIKNNINIQPFFTNT